MASSGVEAEMEHHSENDVGKPKLTSPCMTQQLEDSHDQQLIEKESPNSPSPVKRWEIRPLLQSFKSKMASFTEIVMSPVRLFKPTGSMSSIVLPEQREQFLETNVESSTWTEKEDTVDGKCKSGLLSKRPSLERVQCDPPPKRHRVIQRLDFGTVSSNNHEPVLKQNEMHDCAQVAPKEEDYQLNRPSIQPHAILQDGSQSPYLKLGFIPSSDQPAMQMSCPDNMDTNAIVVLQRLSSTCSSDTACGLNSESKAIFEDSTEQKPDSCHSFSDFLSTDEDTNRGGTKEPCLRKSPRKLIRHQSETVVSTSTELKTFAMSLADEMKELHSINVIEWTHHSAIVSDPPKSTSVADVKSEICRESPTTENPEIQKDMLSKRKLCKAKEGGPRRAKNKRVIILEETQEDIICVRRKKRKAISTAQKLQSSNMGVITSNTAHVETSEACDSTESKEMGREKTLLTSSNKGDAADTISSQNFLGNVLFDRSLQNINTMNDCNCEISRPSDPPGLQDSMQTHDAKKTKARKTRQHVYKSAGEASLQKRNIRPAKHKFEDYNATLVVDPAGPSAPSKRLLLRIDRCCEESQRTIIEAEEQMTSLCDPEAREKKALMSPKILSGREQKPNRPTKIANRQTRKRVSVAKRKHIIESKDKAEKMMKDISVSLSGSSSIRLLRSYSCPEIPSLVFSDFHISPYLTHENCSTSPVKESSAVPLPTLHSPSKRTRRHTVCSVEIEREIAPLCLRKEVYPTVRSGPSHPLCPSSLYSPSNSLTALASCFLSSPLAFLSKNSSQGRDHASDSSTDSTHYSVSSLISSFVPSSSPSLCSSPFASTLTSSNPVNGSSTVVTPSPEISTSVPSLCSTFSQSSLEGDHGITQMECHEVVDEEEKSSFGLQLSTAICEEKALSDSEIKTDHKKGQRGKVSSIRICKKIPKPQNNLTPMGLPKVVRIKKKDFSLEEIYTNKNFSKPPDGRLETIFEVPLNRKDGSQAVVGQKKVKRFVEFPELGVARKPKKPLVGGVAGGGAQRKAGGNSGICRTRRGVGSSSKVKDCLTLQELDSLLFSKLEELDTWMALQQVAC